MTQDEVKQLKQDREEKYHINCIECGENIGEIVFIGDEQWKYKCGDCGHEQSEQYDPF